MARTRRMKAEGGAAWYHIMSRTNDRRFLFRKGRVKAMMVELLERAAEFSGVEIGAHCVMDDHFHVVCRVVRPDGPVPEREVLRRIGALKGARRAEVIAARWAEDRAMGLGSFADAELERWRRRMDDVSEFAKTYKELVNVAYKAMLREEEGREYVGGLWGGRFKSTLIEDGRYLAVCVRYVELNPVRAGMVTRAEDYAYSSRNGRKAAEKRGFAGCVPGWEERAMRRVAQIGSGKVFGGRAFVEARIAWLGSALAGATRARVVFAGAYASHGWRLAAKDGQCAA